MILRIDRLGVELPPPSTPDPAGAAAVQELMGGKFGEMSTLMNYTFQSFNFRFRQGARPFYDLIANIAAEEYGHIEVVAATINTMLTGASISDQRGQPVQAALRFGGKGALPADSHGKPWNGSYVHSSGDLVEDLTHNYFLETGARSGKLRVYEMCDHPAARALTGYLLVRGGVHQVAYARALENLTGADMIGCSRRRGSRPTRSRSASRTSRKGEHLKLYRFSPDDYREIVAVFNGNHPETGEPLEVVDQAPEGFPPYDLPAAARRLRAGLRAGGDRRDRQKLRKAAGLPDKVTGIVANDD